MRKTLERAESARRKLSYRLTLQPQAPMLLTPLHFRRKTLHISTTAAEKERYRLHIQASRLKRYRRLSELSDALTALFPQLISCIIEKKVQARAYTPVELRKLVSSVYWSLRVYMQYDFKQEKFHLRDDYLKELVMLRREITANANGRYFELPELTQARYRYQPHRLHAAASLSRSATD